MVRFRRFLVCLGCVVFDVCVFCGGVVWSGGDYWCGWYDFGWCVIGGSMFL